MALTKAEIQPDKVYWAKKEEDTHFQYLLLVKGDIPFLYIRRMVHINVNGDPVGPMDVNSATIDMFKDEFYDSQWPVTGS